MKKSAETVDDEEFSLAKGDSLDFVGDKPFKGKGTYDVLTGGDGGGGGRYGTRFGGKRNLLARGGGDLDTEGAVLAALRWLAKNQKADGSWDASREDHRTGTTGLSLLAFLGAGYTHLSKDAHDGLCFGDVVRKALQYLLSHQDVPGCLAPRSAEKYMYGHAIATLALVEAYGMTGSNLFKDQAQKALDFLAAAQNPGLGWRYSERCGDSDSSVTGWAVLAFKAAEISGLTFKKSAYDGVRGWFDSMTDNQGRVDYTTRGVGLRMHAPNEHFDHHESMTAAAAVARVLMDKNRADARVKAAVELLLKDKPSGDALRRDYVYWFWGTRALFQFEGAWAEWNVALKTAILPLQDKADHAGSWPATDRWTSDGGRACATAMNALTLEVYYSYPSVFGR